MVALSCLALIGIIWAWTLDRIAVGRAETLAGSIRHNENLALAFEEHTIRTFRGLEQTLSFVRSQYRAQGLKLNLRAMIEDGALDAGLFTFIGVANERGNLVLGSIDFEPVNVSDREHFNFHRQNDTGDVFIGKPILDRATRKWVIPISRRINRPDSSFGGIIFISMDPEYFTRFYQKADLGEQGVIALVGLDGITRARRIGDKNTFGDDLGATALFPAQARNRSGSFFGPGTLDGLPRWGSYRNTEGYPLIVVVAGSVADMMAPFGPRQRGYYVNAAFGSTIVLAFGAFMLAALARRKQALDLLAVSEARYRAVFDQAGVGIALTTPQGRFIEVNEKLCATMGYTSAELCAMTTGDLIAPEDFEITRRDRERVLAGEFRDIVSEARYVRKDRSVGWSNRSLSMVRGADGEPLYFVSVIKDISDRKRAEEQLRASEMQLRQAQRVAKLGSWERDIGCDTPIWSEELYRIFGRDPKLPAPRFGEQLEVYYRQSWERRRAAMENIQKTLAPYELELEFRRPDGTGGWVESRVEAVCDATGKLTKLRGTVLDITERKRAELAAIEQFKLAETFFNHSVSGLVILDRDFNFLRVNLAYAEACRGDIGEFAGRNHFEMYPTDTKAIFEDVVRTRKPFVTFERAFVFPDQPERGVTYWDWTLVPILDAQGEVEYLVLSLNEVTERRRAQKELENSMRRVAALSERVMKVQQEEREGLARELHDELGQTLTALKVNLQMLEPYCAEGEAEGHLTEALMITRRALGQVRGVMLDLRPQGLEELGLALVLERHIAKQAQTAGWEASFAATLPGRLRPELEMACFRVAQEALTNVMRHAGAKQVRVALALGAGEVQLSVRDDGRGFNVAAASDASPMRGFGLIGLRERVRQAGGRLAIDSTPGRGTEVRASFPCEPTGRRASDANASMQA